MAQQYWEGSEPDQCQTCQRDYEGVMYDARLPLHGSWANICRRCFVAFGCRLGTGWGQKYEKQPDGSWLKVKDRPK